MSIQLHGLGPTGDFRPSDAVPTLTSEPGYGTDLLVMSCSILGLFAFVLLTFIQVLVGLLLLSVVACWKARFIGQYCILI